jgi:WD40 repeat protein
VTIAEQRARLVPLLKAPCELPLRIDFRVRLDCTDESNWEHEITRLRDLLGQPEPVPERLPCPYPGIIPFSATDARFFYGRETESKEMLQRLRRQRFLFVIGPSGSGKSSLIRAGLLPVLPQSGYFPPGFWLVREMRLSTTPLQSLAQLLGSVDISTFQPSDVQTLLAANPPAQCLLLVIDQFEELFTQTDRAGQAQFIAALKALQAVEHCALLIAMRADFYPELMNSDLWPVEASQRLEVAPLHGETLRQAIEQPAADVGVYLEAGLLERLVADAADEPGVLPLLQETMVLLWGEMQRRLLPLSVYERLGGEGRSGLAVAIALKADAALAELTSPSQQAIARRIFLRLVQFGEGRADTRRQQPIAGLRSAGDDPLLFDQTLRHLSSHRLLTLSGEEAVAEKKVDMAHEALIGGWPTLQRWLTERREAEQIRRRLEDKTTEWVRLGRSNGGLLDEVELLEAERWLASPDALELGYDAALITLVQESRRAIEDAKIVERQRTEERIKANKRLRLLAVALSVVACVAVGASIMATREQQKAVQAAKRSLSRLLAAQALDYRETQLDLALLLSLEAKHLDDTSEARSSLFEALQYNPSLTTFLSSQVVEAQSGVSARALWAFDTGPGGVAVSPDGRILALGGVAITLWDTATLQPQGVPFGREKGSMQPPRPTFGGEWRIPYAPRGEAHVAEVRNVAFSPDGTALASGGGDCTLMLWDIVTRQRIGSYQWRWCRSLNGVNSVAFSPDGTMVAASVMFSGDIKYSDIVLWDVAAKQVRGSFASGGYYVEILAFSADGKTVALREPPRGNGLGDRMMLLDVATSTLLPMPSVSQTGRLRSVAFSPTDNTVVFGSEDGTITFWNAATGHPTSQPLAGHKAAVSSIAFSRDGTKVATSGSDRTILIRNAATGQLLGKPLTGHKTSVTKVAFLENSTRLISVDFDRTILFWDTAPRQPLVRHLRGPTTAVNSLTLSSDGQRLASSGPDGTVWLWDLRQPSPPTHLCCHVGEVWALAFSPDGQWLASGGEKGTVSLWDIETSQPLVQAVLGAPSLLVNMAFSRDRRQLLLSYADGRAISWDIPTGRAESLLPKSLEDMSGGFARHGVAFNRDGTKLAEHHPDKSIILWDVRRKEPIGRHLEGHNKPITSSVFSADGTKLASHDEEGTIILWDLAAYQPLGQPFLGSTGQMIFSADGTKLASHDKEGTVILWDIAKISASPPRRVRLKDTTTAVRILAFSPDGNTLVSGYTDGTILLWEVSPASWEAHACRIANRHLTQKEWDQFIGPIAPYRRTCPTLSSIRGGPPDARAALR